MEEYLSAVGFNFSNKLDIDEIIELVIKKPTEKYISNFGKDTLKVEMIKLWNKSLGVLLIGELDINEEFIIDNVLPYYNSNTVIDINSLEIEEVSDTKIFFGTFFYEEYDLQISFLLQNTVDYLDIESREDIFINGVKLVGYCEEANILLPLTNNFVDEELKKSNSLDEENNINLSNDDEVEMLNYLKAKVSTNDVFSIVDSLLMPFGIRGDEYVIVGIIKKINEVYNSYTKESIYIFTLSTLDFEIEVCINKKNITGEPLVGRRFKGIIWLQGNVIFSE